jgi:membrane-bound ClpP family serine protease
METICYIKKVPFVKQLFGFSLIILAFLGFVMSGTIFSAIFLAMGCFLIITEGSEIDLGNKKFRTVNLFLGIKFGSWKALPDFEYVSVFKTKQSQRVNFVTATTSFTNDVILLNVFDSKNKYITFYQTDDKEDALKVASHFKLALNIDILDATGAEKIWL